MSSITIELSSEAISKARRIMDKYGVKLEELIKRIIEEFINYDLENVVEYLEKHDYGDLSGLEKVAGAYVDLMELGMLTAINIETYVLEALEAQGYWLEDLGIDLEEFSAWFMFSGRRLVEDFILDVGIDGISLTAIHDISDLVFKNPKVIEELRRATERVKTNHAIVVSEDELRVVARAKRIGDLPKIGEVDDLIKSIFTEAGISRS
ncbi:MAG: hypothetical protein N3E36_00330 [Sulfolobales archaeon]|nr:hypothetical protein [Sulfolobales archaeon]MCX8198474.1 hypothetical protein [Sulfolobales archaeon]MDW8169549.1 hypothetical protein [Desulfurococcaceae archaeon]